ncbi:MAG: DUF3631 domain-containing protein, partial [Pseudonocardiaceae bacterium]
MREQNPDNGTDLLHQVRDALARYVILPSDEAAVGVVLWIAATHAVPAWGHAPRLVIRAPEKRCGKSRLLDLVEAMCHRPLMTVNASPSAVYRSIGLASNDPPTLLMDEADAVFGPKAAGEHEDLRGLLNAGHQRGRPAIRYDAGSRRVERIDTFAMAALAGIGAMPDTIEDRALVIRMRRRAQGETVAPYRVRRDGPALHDLRARLNHWARSNADDLTAAVPVMPVEDRDADTWEPLITVADLAAGGWPDLARDAALVLSEAKQASGILTTQALLLADCRTAFGDADALPSTDLLDRLKADPEAPWATWGHNGLTAVKLGHLLREFDITSRNLRLPSGQAKGYLRTDFIDAWHRYCPTLRGGEPSQPSQPSQNDVSAGQTAFMGGTACETKPSQSRPTPMQAVPAVPQPSHPKTAPDQHKHPAGT